MPGRFNARDEATFDPVEQPPHIDGELLRLGAGQQGAEAEGMQEPALSNPALLLHQGALHDGNLAGRAPEGLQGDPEPHAHRLTEGHHVTSPR